MTIEEILNEPEISKKIEILKQKDIEVPEWKELEKEYNPLLHSIMTDPTYHDVTNPEDNSIDRVTKVIYGLQKLAVNRMTGFMFGIPVQRNYQPKSKGEELAAQYLEKIYDRIRINSENMVRGRSYFAACEMLTLWYSVEEDNNLYGFDSKLKFKCKTYSPMNGDSLYPLFDDTDDLIAISIGYKRKRGGKDIEYFDTYTKDKHVRFKSEGNEWLEEINEPIILQKIPAIYESRSLPIWEHNTKNVEEIEWALSRNGNYIRKNSKPILAVYAEEDIPFNQEKSEKVEYKGVFQYPPGSKLEYVTWTQAIDLLKYHVDTLERIFFSSIQLPDISYDNMKVSQMSGEARKQMLVDMFIKVVEESGKILKFLDREMNVAKAFLKQAVPTSMHKDIDSLQVEQVIEPFTLNDEKEKIQMLMTATGGMSIMSQRTGVLNLGFVTDVDKEIEQIRQEQEINAIDDAE